MSVHAPRLALLLALVTAGLGATPVPHPAEVRPGAAAVADVVAWVPGVQVVTGAAGEVVAVDLALDDGTADAAEAELTVHAVTVDPAGEPVLGGPSDTLTLATDRVTVGPGDRVVLRATATVPDAAVVAAVRAELVDAAEPAHPTAFVLVGPAVPDDVTPSVRLDGEVATVTVANATAAPTVVDLVVRSSSWAGRSRERTVTDVLVGGGATRTITLEAAGGAGRRTVVAAVRPRGGTTRVATARSWAPGTLPTLVAVVLLAVAATAVLGLRRRRR